MRIENGKVIDEAIDVEIDRKRVSPSDGWGGSIGLRMSISVMGLIGYSLQMAFFFRYSGRLWFPVQSVMAISTFIDFCLPWEF